MNPDGVSYLDIGDAWARGDWNAALNGYWSPLYPWLLGFGLKILRPSAAWEFPVVHAINFGIYLVSLGAFVFFWSGVMAYAKRGLGPWQQPGTVALPDSAWVLLGYVIFLISSLEYIGLTVVSPDLCLSAFVYLATGLGIRIRGTRASWRMYFALGLAFGLAYLTKPAMLMLSVVFLACNCTMKDGVWTMVRRLSTAALGFALVAGPYIVALSRHQGHVTASEAGPLAYAWVVNRVPFLHWSDLKDYGRPIHPSKKIFETPAAYEFENIGQATYPGWYDPARWLAGVEPRFNLRQQLVALKTDSQILLDLCLSRFNVALISGVIALYLFYGGWRDALGGVRANWSMLVPSLAAVAVFWLVWIESRYIGPFAALFWGGVLLGVRVPDSEVRSKVPARLAAAVAVVTFATIAVSTASDMDLVGTNPPVDPLRSPP